MARITVFSKNRKAIESCVELLEGLGHQVFSHRGVKKGFDFTYAIENDPDERKLIESRLREWLEKKTSMNFSGRRHMMGLYLINLPFEKDEDVPDLPKSRIYSKDSNGFSTNPENWKKGLSLL